MKAIGPDWIIVFPGILSVLLKVPIIVSASVEVRTTFSTNEPSFSQKINKLGSIELVLQKNNSFC